MKLKSIYGIFAAAAVMLLASCSDEVTVATPAERGTVTDAEGNTYGWVRIGNKLWTTSNALNGTPMEDATYNNNFSDLNVFEEDDMPFVREYKTRHGNMMSYADAVASAPAGWRLPTDADWAELEGMAGKDAATVLQSRDSGPELGLSLGGRATFKKNWGMMDLEFADEGMFGYYWTSTIEPRYTDNPEAYYRRISMYNGRVERNCARVESLLSVRWVKDAD